MDVGNGLQISDKYFTPKTLTGLYDRNGVALSIADPVKIFGCQARRGYIGKTERGSYVVYFATTCTVQWFLTPKTLRLIEKIESDAG